MGQKEKEVQKRGKQVPLQKIILRSVAGAGLLSVAILAPNVLGAMAKLGLLPKKRQDNLITVSRNNLIRSGLLQHKDGFLCLTEAGDKKLRLLELRDFKIRKPKRWDGKWRVLIFDIPEKRRGIREKVRRTLVSIGFVRIQDSVWVYPYDCEDLITLLKADFRIGKDILYLIVEMMENDRSLREHFGFSQEEE